MKTTLSALTITIMILISSLIVLPASSNPINTTSAGNTLYVGGTEPGNYTKIQDAINNSNNGDTVFVYNGEYNENIVVNKSITLKGEDKENTIIKSEADEDTINIISENVNLSGFLVINDIGDYTISVFNSNNVIVKNNKIDEGTIILSDCTNCKILNNSIIGRIFVYNSQKNIISENRFEKSHICLTVCSSENNISYNEIIIFDSITGIKIDSGCTKNTFSYNVIKFGIIGLEIFEPDNEISYNDFYFNAMHVNINYYGHCNWHRNYWGRPIFHPKILFGFGGYPTVYGFDIAWRPAKKPNCDFGGLDQ